MHFKTESTVEQYRNLKNKIPLLKEKLCVFLNEYHGVQKSKEFWWVLGGDYALYAEHFSGIAKKDSRLLYELERYPKTFLRIKDLGSR